LLQLELQTAGTDAAQDDEGTDAVPINISKNPTPIKPLPTIFRTFIEFSPKRYLTNKTDELIHV
jgi:hypothetical protein